MCKGFIMKMSMWIQKRKEPGVTEGVIGLLCMSEDTAEKTGREYR